LSFALIFTGNIWMKPVYMAAAVLVLLGSPVRAQEHATDQDAPALADFEARVKKYAALRDELNKGAAKQRETEHPEKIAAAQAALAAKIRARRAAAKPGDIFTPLIQERIRRLLAPEMKGVDGKNTRGSIWDEGPGPGAFKLEVNSVYPKDQPLGTMPPNVLKALPPLPEGLEYRFVYRHLVIRDQQPNLIVDFMPAAIPGK
jgi:hypothetical protein